MGSPAARLLLESVLAPFVLAALLLMAARWAGQARFAAFLQAPAIVLAIGTTYILAFGWPDEFVPSARSKIMLAAFGGLAIGMILEQRARWARLVLIAGAIGLPIWIGFPAIEQGRPESALLAIPIIAALIAPSLMGMASSGIAAPADAGVSAILIALTLAIGLAAIAVLASAFSFAELCLSLGSALLAILALSGRGFETPAALTTAALLSALITAMLLYSEASPLALFVLVTVIGAERLARLTNGQRSAKTATPRTFIFCLLPAAAAILIARIDAAPFSLY